MVTQCCCQQIPGTRYQNSTPPRYKRTELSIPQLQHTGICLHYTFSASDCKYSFKAGCAYRHQFCLCLALAIYQRHLQQTEDRAVLHREEVKRRGGRGGGGGEQRETCCLDEIGSDSRVPQTGTGSQL